MKFMPYPKSSVVIFSQTCKYLHEPHCFLRNFIPQLNTPNYSEMRNRVMDNGDEWLTEECKVFFDSKLYEANKPYTKLQQAIHSVVYPFLLLKWFLRDWKNNLHRIGKYLKRIGK